MSRDRVLALAVVVAVFGVLIAVSVVQLSAVGWDVCEWTNNCGWRNL